MIQSFMNRSLYLSTILFDLMHRTFPFILNQTIRRVTQNELPKKWSTLKSLKFSRFLDASIEY